MHLYKTGGVNVETLSGFLTVSKKSEKTVN